MNWNCRAIPIEDPPLNIEIEEVGKCSLPLRGVEDPKYQWPGVLHTFDNTALKASRAWNGHTSVHRLHTCVFEWIYVKKKKFGRKKIL